MSKAHAWTVVYVGGGHSMLSNTERMTYQQARTRAAYHKRQGDRGVRIVRADKLRAERDLHNAINGFLGGPPCIV